MARLIKTPEVAAKLGVTVPRFYRMRKDLDAAGFPQPRRPFSNRWADEDVDRWITAGGTAPEGQGADRKVEASAAPAPDDNDLAAWGDRLRARAREANL